MIQAVNTSLLCPKIDTARRCFCERAQDDYLPSKEIQAACHCFNIERVDLVGVVPGNSISNPEKVLKNCDVILLPEEVLWRHWHLGVL